MVVTDGDVELLQQLDRLEVLATAVTVRQPLTRLAAVVEVEHRGHRVDPQSVDVIVLEPVERIGDEEIAHLVPPVVEDLRAPVRVLAEPRIGVLVERGAVERREAVLVARKVRRDPVDDHAEAGLVAAVDEIHQVLRRPVPRRRRVVPHHLVAPGAVVRILGDAHQLDVRECQVAHVGNELVRELAPVREGW